MLRVVSGVAKSGGVVLMGLRNAHKLRPKLWELPGGKVEDGETPQQALEREWTEEIGIKVTAGELIASAVFELELVLVVDLYAVYYTTATQRIEAKDHDELRWLDPAYAVKYMPCSPGFYAHYPRLMAWMRGDR